jgi:hypothetical protein
MGHLLDHPLVAVVKLLGCLFGPVVVSTRIFGSILRLYGRFCHSLLYFVIACYLVAPYAYCVINWSAYKLQFDKLFPTLTNQLAYDRYICTYIAVRGAQW